MTAQALPGQAGSAPGREEYATVEAPCQESAGFAVVQPQVAAASVRDEETHIILCHLGSLFLASSLTLTLEYKCCHTVLNLKQKIFLSQA